MAEKHFKLKFMLDLQHQKLPLGLREVHPFAFLLLALDNLT
jgi:hypothetical protein